MSSLFADRQARLEAAAGTANLITFVPPPGETWRLKSITYMPDATSAANGTNYGSLRAYKGTGTSTPIHAARTTASVDLTLGTKIVAAASGDGSPDINFSASGSDLEITDSNPLSVQLTHAGTGVATRVTVAARFERVRAAA